MMSKIYNWVASFLAWLVEPVAAEDTQERRSPQDWADLPIHHPRCD